jgi:hypothetical protein
MHILCRNHFALKIGAIEGGGGVIHYKRREAEVARHSSGGVHAVVGGESHQHHRLDGGCAQVRFEACAYERAVHVFGEQKLTGFWHSKLFQIEAALHTSQRDSEQAAVSATDQSLHAPVPVAAASRLRLKSAECE